MAAGMHAALTALLMACVLLASVQCDIYMHNPRGTNNRNRERNRNVDNNNRLFNSQNNDAGGYHWGPHMEYYPGSILPVEWTNQHGCGDSQGKVRCELVLQYMCHENLRDGRTTDTIADDLATYDENLIERNITGIPIMDEDTETRRYGMHEVYDYYQDCKARDRNSGLFVADQTPGPKATSTRQQPGNTQYGFECPEERDYYPYWHPTPWIDIAVLTYDTGRCDYYQEQSENVVGRHTCSDNTINNEEECLEAGGNTWDRHNSHDEPPPECLKAPWSRVNHLGNSVDGYASRYNWTLPDTASGRCVLRIRYNISSGDYDGWNTFSEYNGDEKSPVVNDPTFETNGRNLTYAINTAQFGRTFQDRSQAFIISERLQNAGNQARIFNVNVRGKRGNIVQVYPSVEYDFVPNILEVVVGDYIHFQWTGSDDNPNGRDGEGAEHTDRSNVVVMNGLSENHPGSFQSSGLFEDADSEHHAAHLGQENCLEHDEIVAKHGSTSNNAAQNDPQNCLKLNAATRRFTMTPLRVKSDMNGKTVHYLSSRNNNFTNRSQKGVITILYSPDTSPFIIAAIGIVVFGGTVAVVTPLALLAPTLLTAIVASVSQRI